MSSLYLPPGLDVVGNLAYDLRVELASILHGSSSEVLVRLNKLSPGRDLIFDLVRALNTTDNLLLKMKEVLDAERKSASTSS